MKKQSAAYWNLTGEGSFKITVSGTEITRKKSNPLRSSNSDQWENQKENPLWSSDSDQWDIARSNRWSQPTNSNMMYKLFDTKNGISDDENSGKFEEDMVAAYADDFDVDEKMFDMLQLNHEIMETETTITNVAAD